MNQNPETASARPVRLIIVDDSRLFREYLRSLLSERAGFIVAGVAEHGKAALELIDQLNPDIILMDVNMPVMDGLQTTRHIMSTRPVPIILLSAVAQDEVKLSFDALEAGALAAFPKPPGPGHPDQAQSVHKLLASIRALCGVKLVRRRQVTQRGSAHSPGPGASFCNESCPVVVIGASTGGPPVVSRILSALPSDFLFPIMLVQHISPGFVTGFVDWLGSACPLNVKLAADRMELEGGTVYVAPDDHHLLFLNRGQTRLQPRDSCRGHCPSVGALFKSAADVYGSSVVAILLTGMGTDGAAELRSLRDLGAETIAQNRETSVVFGMPGEAVRIGAANKVLSPMEIACYLSELSNRRLLHRRPVTTGGN